MAKKKERLTTHDTEDPKAESTVLSNFAVHFFGVIGGLIHSGG
jgi:hypothetical protein